jgi:hypothetical protein
MKRWAMLSGFACLLATAFVVAHHSFGPGASPGGPLQVRVIRGDLNVLFPDGLTSEAGDIDSPRELGYEIAIVNASAAPLDLGRFEVATPCCTPAKIERQSTVLGPGERGALRFRMQIAGRPGRNITRVPITIAAAPPSAPGGLEELFAIHLGYVLQSRGFVNWSDPEIDFGDVWRHSATLHRDVDLILQYDGSERRVDPVIAPPQPALSVETVAERIDSGRFDNPTRIIGIRCTLDPSQLAVGSYVTGIAADGATLNRRLPVRWRVVDEYQFFPDGKLLIPRSPGRPTTFDLAVRHAGRCSFLVKHVSCTVKALYTDALPDRTLPEVVIRLHIDLDATPEAATGILGLTLVRDGGEECTRDVEFEIVDLP